MSLTKELGKITSCYHGMGGYQDAMMGYGFELGSGGWGVSDFWGTWAHRPKGAKWSDAEQKAALANAMIRVRDLLEGAHVDSFEKLKGKPVEVIFENGLLKSWRILTEVLG